MKRDLSKRNLTKRGEKCDGCAHWRPIYDKGDGPKGPQHGEMVCHYILDEGRARGCSVEDCDKYRKLAPGEKIQHMDVSEMVLEVAVFDPIKVEVDDE